MAASGAAACAAAATASLTAPASSASPRPSLPAPSAPLPVWPLLHGFTPAPASSPRALPWRMLLHGEGGFTNMFKVVTGSPTRVDIIDVADVESIGADAAPPEAAALGAGSSGDGGAPATLRVRRVWLANAAGARLGYAVSWWLPSVYDATLTNPSAPIGGSLAAAHAAVHRQLHAVFHGRHGALAVELGGTPEETLWGRYYTMWRGGAPLCVVAEVLCPSAWAPWLGPVGQGEDEERQGEAGAIQPPP